MTIVIGWVVFASSSTTRSSDSDADSLTYIAWVFIVPVAFGPLFTWALVTYLWRPLLGPTRAVRLCTAFGLLVVPGLVIPGLIVEMAWPDAGGLQARIVAVSGHLALVVGVLLTGRVLRAKHAALAIGLVAIASSIAFLYAADV